MQYLKENGAIDWKQVYVNTAIAAMQAIISNEKEVDAIEEVTPSGNYHDGVAEEATYYADALVNRLRKTMPAHLTD